MGTCYSKSGHDAAEGNSKNQPISKESGRHQPNGSLYVYRPGKDHSSQSASASQSGNVSTQDKGEEVLKINTIDSGIESLTSSQCNKELKELTENSELREATDTFELIDNGPCACGENCEVNGHCKFECLSKLPESNVEWNSGHGRPLSQPARKCESSIPLHRKPRCKGRIERKSSRLSWKSTDSLDWTRTMVTTMDRTTSQVSDIFVDDISLHAPLAHFDSIEFSGEDKDSETNGVAKTAVTTVVAAAVTANNGEVASTACSATILISNDKQPSPCKKQAESGEGANNVQSVEYSSKEMNLEDIVKKQLSSQSLLGSREGESSSLAGSLLSFPPKSEVTSVVVDGKEVVLIDADTYSQVMDEIALLKTKLGQLTSVIQTESLNYCDPGSGQSPAWATGTLDTSYSFDQNIVDGTPTVQGGVGDQVLGNVSSSVQPTPTDAPSSAEQPIADLPPSAAEPPAADHPSSPSEKLPADVSLLAEKLIAEVLPASAAQLAMMTPSSAKPQDSESPPTENLDPAPPESAPEPVDSLSAPPTSEGQTVPADPSTNADSTSPKT